MSGIGLAFDAGVPPGFSGQQVVLERPSGHREAPVGADVRILPQGFFEGHSGHAGCWGQALYLLRLGVQKAGSKLVHK